jgi:hypothetical protein
MFSPARLPRILGFAAVLLPLVLAGCGSSSSSNANNITTLPPPSGPRQVQALVTTALSNNPAYGNFVSDVLPHITGVSLAVRWSDIESTNAAGTGSGGYDFTDFDSTYIQPYLSAGATVNLIVWPATEGGDNEPGPPGSTPAYVFTQAWANTAANTSNAPLQDMTVCPNYEGDSGSPYGQPNFTNGGIWNSSNPTYGSDLSGLPVSYEAPFMTAYQNFIKAVIANYNSGGPSIAAGKIGYIRFGFSQGGENSPECNQFWPNFTQTNSQGQTTYLSYVQTMTDFVKSQNPTMTILEDLHSPVQNGDPGYTQYPDAEAGDAVADDFGFGTNGLQVNDTQGGQCDSDWCNLFAKYDSTEYNGTPIRLSLQTLQWTDPAGTDPTNPTGSLTVLEPFAKANGANNLELYLADLALAYDPADYCIVSQNSKQCEASLADPSQYSSAYAAAIADFLSP